MKVVVVYESMFGATHDVANAVARGLEAAAEVQVVPAVAASPDVLDRADLLVVGGPTHIHGMSSKRSRHMAADMAAQPDNQLHLDPDAESEGLRDWFHDLPRLPRVTGAAFDTRIGSVSPTMSGRASKGIARRLRHHGVELLVPPESFLVDDHNQLVNGEQERAFAWGEALLVKASDEESADS